MADEHDDLSDDDADFVAAVFAALPASAADLEVIADRWDEVEAHVGPDTEKVERMLAFLEACQAGRENFRARIDVDAAFRRFRHPDPAMADLAHLAASLCHPGAVYAVGGSLTERSQNLREVAAWWATGQIPPLPPETT